MSSSIVICTFSNQNRNFFAWCNIPVLRIFFRKMNKHKLSIINVDCSKLFIYTVNFTVVDFSYFKFMYKFIFFMRIYKLVIKVLSVWLSRKNFISFLCFNMRIRFSHFSWTCCAISVPIKLTIV